MLAGRPTPCGATTDMALSAHRWAHLGDAVLAAALTADPSASANVARYPLDPARTSAGA